jgi:hypothetical protein
MKFSPQSTKTLRAAAGKTKPNAPRCPVAAALPLDGEYTKRRRLASLVVARTPKGEAVFLKNCKF